MMKIAIKITAVFAAISMTMSTTVHKLVQISELLNVMAHSTYTPADARVNGYADEVIAALDWSEEREEFIAATIADGASRTMAENAAREMFGEGV